MDVVMPQLGETVAEGTIAAWLKKPGDRVTAGDNLLEIETDKTTMEVQATGSGVLQEILIEAGQTVKVGTVIAVIADRAPRVLSAVTVPVDVRGSSRAMAFDPLDPVRTPMEHFGPAKLGNGVRVTPLARRLIAQHGLDVMSVAERVARRGEGVVRKADVMAEVAGSPLQLAQERGAVPRAIEAPAPVPRRASSSREVSIVPLNRIRQASARHLTHAWQSAPHVLQAVEIDFERVASVRSKNKGSFQAAHGAPLTFLPFIVRAVCLALAAFPQVNARLDGDNLAVSRDVHVGIAVDLGHEGLVAPVVRHADLMNITGLAKAIDAVVQKARAGRLVPEDVEGGTYSISNNGSFGTLFTAPIINVPQVAILSTDTISKRAVVKETEVGDVIVVRHVGIVAQSFDHRAFDGAYAAAYLRRLKEIIETRDWAGEF